MMTRFLSLHYQLFNCLKCLWLIFRSKKYDSLVGGGLLFYFDDFAFKLRQVFAESYAK